MPIPLKNFFLLNMRNYLGLEHLEGEYTYIYTDIYIYVYILHILYTRKYMYTRTFVQVYANLLYHIHIQSPTVEPE